jgi:hypothetical protein
MDKLLEDVKQVLSYAQRMRGETTDEDLVEKLTWQLESIVEEHDAA